MEQYHCPALKPHYPFEPLFWRQRDFDQLLEWACIQGASDLILSSDRPISMEAHGKRHHINLRHLTTIEITSMIEGALGQPLETYMSSGVDFAYETQQDENKRRRFRVNATPFHTGSRRGWHITLRHLPRVPPSIDTLGVDRALVDHLLTLKQGLVLVTGHAGSGKTTLVASLLREAMETKNNRKIHTVEAPTEFTYAQVDPAAHKVFQYDAQLPGHSYRDGIHGAMRRRASEIFVGTLPNTEAVEQTITAAMVGYLVYTTADGHSCAEVIEHILMLFDPQERDARMIDLLASLRVVVAVKMETGTSGACVPLFQTLIVDDELVDHLVEGGLEQLSLNINQTLKSRGLDFASDAKRKLDAGLISDATQERVTG